MTNPLAYVLNQNVVDNGGVVSLVAMVEIFRPIKRYTTLLGGCIWDPTYNRLKEASYVREDSPRLN